MQGIWLRLFACRGWRGAGAGGLREEVAAMFTSDERIWRAGSDLGIELEDFPAVVTIDAHGNSLHKTIFAAEPGGTGEAALIFRQSFGDGGCSSLGRKFLPMIFPSPSSR